jgi:hypothetical protein
MPLLASSSLLIVQRMTTLSATFVLCGLAGYMAARRHVAEQPRVALAGMTLALVVCTLFALLTKENGVLLPTFVLVIEVVLLGPPRSLSPVQWNTWRGLFLATPTLLIVAYLVTQAPYSDDLVARRGFAAADRLFGEARILWEYLLNAFYAPGAELGPFHESRRADAPLSDPLTVAAVIAWILAFGRGIRRALVSCGTPAGIDDGSARALLRTPELPAHHRTDLRPVLSRAAGAGTSTLDISGRPGGLCRHQCRHPVWRDVFMG